jgi:hypothetical protein
MGRLEGHQVMKTIKELLTVKRSKNPLKDLLRSKRAALNPRSEKGKAARSSAISSLASELAGTADKSARAYKSQRRGLERQITEASEKQKAGKKTQSSFERLLKKKEKETIKKRISKIEHRGFLVTLKGVSVEVSDDIREWDFGPKEVSGRGIVSHLFQMMREDKGMEEVEGILGASVFDEYWYGGRGAGNTPYTSLGWSNESTFEVLG